MRVGDLTAMSDRCIILFSISVVPLLDCIFCSSKDAEGWFSDVVFLSDCILCSSKDAEGWFSDNSTKVFECLSQM